MGSYIAVQCEKEEEGRSVADSIHRAMASSGQEFDVNVIRPSPCQCVEDIGVHPVFEHPRFHGRSPYWNCDCMWV